MRFFVLFFALFATAAAIKCYATGGEKGKVPSPSDAFDCPVWVNSCLSAVYTGRISGFQRNTVAWTCDFNNTCKKNGCSSVVDGELKQTTCCCSNDLCNGIANQ